MDVGGIPQRGLPDRGWPDRGLPAAGEGFAVKLKKSPSGLAPCVANDYLGLKVWNGTTIVQNGWKVISVTDPGGGYDYVDANVTRVYGSIATFPEGAAVVNYGQSGDGFVKVTADESYAPFIDIAEWSGDDPWTGTVTPHVRLGNLDGVLGLSEQWGLAAGKDLSDDTEPHVIISDQQVGLFGVAQTWWDSGGNARAAVDPTAGSTDKLFWAGLSSSDPRFIVYGDGTTWLSTLAISSDVGAMFFSQADGLALWGPGCKLVSTGAATFEWTSTRGLVASGTGAHHQEAGRWPGTRGLRIEEAGENFELAPRMIDAGSNGIADGWTYWDGFGSGGSITLTVDAHPVAERGWLQRYQYTGAAGDVGDTGGMFDKTAAASFAAGDAATLSFEAKGALSGCILQLEIQAENAANANLGSVGFSVPLTWSLTRYSVTYPTLPANTDHLRIAVWVKNVSDGDTVDAYWGAVNCEKEAYATSFCCGTLDWCAWSGTADASTSTRTITVVTLNDHVGLFNNNDTISFSTWIQMPFDSDATWPTGTNYFTILATGATAKFTMAYLASGAYNDMFRVDWAAGVSRITSSAQSFSAGDWMHLVATVDCVSNVMKFYINGILEDTDTSAIAAQTATSWHLGGYTDQAAGWVISERAVFDRVLTASEVAALYQRNAPLVDTGALETPGAYILDGRFLFASSTTGKHTEITAAGLGIYDGTGPTGVGRILGGFVNTTSKELDITSDDLGWFGYDASNVLQVAWYGSGANAGKITAGAGAAAVDTDGFSITVSTTEGWVEGYKFTDGSNWISGLKAYRGATANALLLKADSVTGRDSLISITTDCPAGEVSQVSMYVKYNSVTGPAFLLYDNGTNNYGQFIGGGLSIGTSASVSNTDGELRVYADARFGAGLAIGTLGTDPDNDTLYIANGAGANTPSSGAVFYAVSGEMWAKDSGGNATQLTPHSFDLIPGGPSEPLAWSYYSERHGRCINVDMLRVVRLVEQLSSEQLVFIKTD